MSGTSQLIKIDEVKSLLDKVESLFGIPKLIIVDSCRGDEDNKPKSGFLLPKRDKDSRHGNFIMMEKDTSVMLYNYFIAQSPDIYRGSQTFLVRGHFQ